MNVRIVADSSSDLSAAAKERVRVVPITITFGDDEFIDGVTIDHHKFYEKLIESDVLPKTSQPSPESFRQAYQEARDAGEEVVVITVSSRLSGTYQSAMIAAQEYDGVYVVDSRSVAIGAGILAEYALMLADEGMDAKSIFETLTERRDDVRVIALLDTLEYLKRGGRISSAAAFAGSLLSIKPVICIDEGEVKILGKARGSRQGNNLLIKEIEASGGVDFDKPLLLGYTGLSDMLLKKYIADSSALWEGNVKGLPVTVVGSSVGTHAGPGAVAVAYFRK